MSDFHIAFILKELLAGRHVVLIVVDAQYLRLLQVAHDGREGSSGGSPDIQHILDGLVAAVPEPDLSVGASS